MFSSRLSVLNKDYDANKKVLRLDTVKQELCSNSDSDLVSVTSFFINRNSDSFNLEKYCPIYSSKYVFISGLLLKLHVKARFHASLTLDIFTR